MTPDNAEEFQGIGDPIYARVRARIRQDILCGVFAPGVRIKIAELSNRYGVSQMPIREALQQLQGEGLITIVPNKGARVRSVDERFIRNIYDIRAAIEVLLARQSAEAMTDSQIFALHAAQARHEEAVQRGDIGKVLEANKNFHELIYRMADNPEGMEIIGRHWDLLEGLRRKYGYGPNRLAEMISEHRQLLRALDRHEVQLAEKIIREHCEHAKQDLLAQTRLAPLPQAEPRQAEAAGFIGGVRV